MKNLLLFFAAALPACLFFSACGEDDFEATYKSSVAFSGRVIDELGQSVQGALVSTEKASVITDANGVFLLKSAVLPADHAILKVEKNGYFTISRPHKVANNSTQALTIQLLRKNPAGTLQASSGGEIAVAGGPRLIFPANAIAHENGSAYTGQALVVARYLDPSDPGLGLFMPGNMTAENSAGEAVFLATYGMIAVEIEGFNGEKLQVAAGKQVELRMPVIAAQSASAPATIPLWYYDQVKGLWIEEGTAQKIGNEYVGSVSHFSFWNCDAPFPVTELKGRIFLESTNMPLGGAHIRMTMLSTGSISYGFTDSDGKFSGAIPVNEALKMEVMLNYTCMDAAYTQQIAPVQGPTILPDIIIPTVSLDATIVSGKLVECSGQPVNNGYVKVKLGNNEGVAFTTTNGDFNFVTINCTNTPLAGELIGYDQNNFLESQPISLNTPPSQISLGNIQVCTALTEFINFTLDGQAFTIVDPQGYIVSDSVPLGTYYNRISGVIDTGSQQIVLAYISTGIQTGTFPLLTLFVNNLEVQMQQSVLSTVVTGAAANPGDFMAGTFGGSFLDHGGNSHLINGNYRVIRDW
jgi:hypothetical protein